MDAFPQTKALSSGVRYRYVAGGSGGGTPGESGPEGKSAYQVAVDQGFVGDVDAWLNSLVGGNNIAATFETVNRNLEAEGASTSVNGGGVLTAVSYGSGVVKTFAYNGEGRVTTVTLSGATPAGIDLVKTYSYNPDGSFDWSYS